MEELLNQINLTTLSMKESVIALAIFICIDVLTGFMNAGINHEIDSTKMREGLQRKANEILLVLVSGISVALLHLPEGFAIATCVFFIINELISIIENIGKYAPIPQIIKDLLEKLNSLKGDKNNG